MVKVGLRLKNGELYIGSELWDRSNTTVDTVTCMMCTMPCVEGAYGKEGKLYEPKEVK